MISLGFDASSTVVGFAFTQDKKILDASFIDISNVETSRGKANYVMDTLMTHKLISQVGQVNLEASLSGFAGPSNRAVVIMLARWGAVFEHMLVDRYNMPVNLVNVNTARKQVFGKARIKGIKPKEYVKTQIEAMYDLSAWEVKNTKGNPDKRMEDVRDAIVISLFRP